MPNLSAGRVQSVALRLVVERSASGWPRRRPSTGTSRRPWPWVPSTPAWFRSMAAGSPPARDFDDRGQLHNPDVLTLTLRPRDDADALTGQEFEVTDVTEKPSAVASSAVHHIHAAAGGFPETRWGPADVAGGSGTHERGYITYIRTDSTVLSATARRGCRGHRPPTCSDPTMLPRRSAGTRTRPRTPRRRTRRSARRRRFPYPGRRRR